MPYKRKRRCNAQSGKQKRITSRLMEISLKVDDYVYNNKIIAETDAENYIQEVASYKLLCGNDERCLQVIEKLTRIMKGIIAEQQELTSENICNENNPFENGDQIDGSISPVYSTPDEDRTQCTQVMPEDSIENVVSKRDKEIIDLCDSDDEKLQEDIAQEIPSMIVDVEIHRGMPDLSLIPMNEGKNQMSSADNECSQSILKHFNNNEINVEEQVKQNGTVQVTPSNGDYSQSILKNIEINKDQLTRYTEHVSSIEIKTTVYNDSIINVNKTPNPIVNTPRHTKIAAVTGVIPKSNHNTTFITNPTQVTITNIQIDKTEINATSTSNNEITPSYTQNITNINNNPPTIGSSYHSANIHDESRNKNAISNIETDNVSSTFSALNKNGPTDNAIIVQYNVNTQLDNKQIQNKNTVNGNKKYKPYDVRVNAARENKTKSDDSSPTTKKRSRKKKNEKTPVKQKIITAKMPVANRTAINKVKQPKKIIQIYKSNTENDLSWVENIRFVREINENEYDRQLKFEDDFWDNYSIPGIWDDQDFKLT